MFETMVNKLRKVRRRNRNAQECRFHAEKLGEHTLTNTPARNSFAAAISPKASIVLFMSALILAVAVGISVSRPLSALKRRQNNLRIAPGAEALFVGQDSRPSLRPDYLGRGMIATIKDFGKSYPMPRLAVYIRSWQWNDWIPVFGQYRLAYTTSDETGVLPVAYRNFNYTERALMRVSTNIQAANPRHLDCSARIAARTMH